MNDAGVGLEVVAKRKGVRWSRVIGFGFGVALLAGAVVAVQRTGGSLGDAFEPLTRADPLLGVGLIASILVSSLVTAALLWVLTGRYGRVGYWEMWALINAAWLLNYLPVRPGMFGRLAYHRSVNKIRIVDSAKALVWTNVLMLIGAVLCGMIAVFASLIGRGGSHWLVIAASAAPIPCFALFAAYAHRKRPEPDPEVWRILLGLGLGYAAQLSWALRFMVSFWLMGLEMSWGGAVALAAVAALAAFVPITGNGLGVREWVIGLVAPMLPVALVSVGNLTRTNSLASDLMNRAAELVVAVPIGLICGWWVLRNAARVRARMSIAASEEAIVNEFRDSVRTRRDAEPGDSAAG